MYLKTNAYRKLRRFLNWIIWAVAIPVFVHFLISIGEKAGFLEKINSLYYWIMLIYSLVISYTLAFAITKFPKYFNKRKNVKYIRNDFILSQLIFEFLSSLLVLTLFALLCFYFLNEKMLQENYFMKELPLIGLILCVFNGFYIAVYLNKSILNAIKKENEQKQLPGVKRLSVYYKGAYILINLMEIAFINQSSHINWLITFKGEEYILDQTLKEIFALLDAQQFFKINRNQIVNKEIIKSFKQGTFGKLELKLKTGKATTVSKDRAKEFRRWLSIKIL
ncbi:MAG: LytTR family DNA-binding domain-containing protein [Bacteroidota bacterium]